MTARSHTEAHALEPIRAAARLAERRMRMGRAIATGVIGIARASGLGTVALAMRKTGLVHEVPSRAFLALLALAPFAAALVSFLRPLDAYAGRAGAIALDRFHGLADCLSSALAFAREPAPTPFMHAAIDDALAHVGAVDPARAVPFRRPPHLAIAAGLSAALVVTALFEVRRHVPVTHAPTIEAVDVTADDLDAMREFLAQVKDSAQTESAKAAVEEFNQLIEDLAARRLDRTAAFEKMRQLEDALLEGREADAKALEDALKKIGDEMKASELTKPAGEALDAKDLVDAEKQLKDVAKKLRDGKADKAQLDKLREALARASQAHAKSLDALAKRREELQKQLLAQRNRMGDGGAEDQERSLLQKRQRELERLNRDQEQAESAGRQLDRLDRQLAQAAEDLMKDLGLSASDLDKGAEDINRMRQEQQSQEEKEQMRQKLEELREMLRQGKMQGRQTQLRRFQQQAHGKGGQQGQGQGGQQGQGQGEGQQQGPGQGGQGQQQQGGGQGEGQGQGAGSNGEVMVLGPNGQPVLMLSRSSGGGGSESGNGGGEPGGSKSWGSEHDGHVQGGATNLKSGTQSTQVAGQDTGQGASRSEVIEGAAERGFASRGYQKVYREYQTVAEEALGKDDIPGGYRFYVRRYFELIRPRDQAK